MSPVVLGFLKSAVLPAFVVALLFLFTGTRAEPLRARLQSLIWALGFFLGSALLFNRVEIPPHDVNMAFGWCALVLTVFVWINPRPIGSRYAIRMAFIVAIGLLTLWPIHESLSGQVHVRNLFAFMFLALGTWSIMERTAGHVQLTTMIFLPMLSAIALSILLLFKGSASLSQLVSVVCALFGANLVLAFVWPKRVGIMALLPFLSVFVILFMVIGHFYLEINPWFMIYLCVPYLAIWVRGLLPFVPKSPIGEPLTLGILSSIPLAYFLWTVIQTSGPLY